MSFLTPHFDPDIFVSYSHGGPSGAGTTLLKSWTHALLDKLKDQIQSLDTEFDDLVLWFDREIDPTSQLTEALRAKVGASGVLLIIMSNRYLASTWCRDELDWFRAQVEARMGDLGRVFVVRAQKTDHGTWPDFLRDERGHAMTGFAFHDAEGRPYGWPVPLETDRDFMRELGRLEVALKKRLREFHNRTTKRVEAQAAARAVALAPAPHGPRRIYLHAAPDGEGARSELGRVLTQSGILPMTTLTVASGDMAQWQRDAKIRMETAKRCDALALLRADESDDRFVDDVFEIGVDERERIGLARGRPLPCAVLDKTGVPLPLDVSGFGIEHFDVSRDGWPGAFASWLDAALSGAAKPAAP